MSEVPGMVSLLHFVDVCISAPTVRLMNARIPSWKANRVKQKFKEKNQTNRFWGFPCCILAGDRPYAVGGKNVYV